MLEGATLLGEALAAGVEVELVLAAGDDPAVDAARQAGVTVVAASPEAVRAAASTVTPQPIVAAARWCDAPADVLDHAAFALVAAGLADPGNAGTLIRSAHAAGADAVVLGPGSVDAFNPKVVRAAAGALFRVPLVLSLSTEDALDRLGRAGVRRLGAAAREGDPYDRVDLRAPAALVVGSEAHGLAPEVRARLDGLVHIPMREGAESLNAGVAGSILCFEVARQRR